MYKTKIYEFARSANIVMIMQRTYDRKNVGIHWYQFNPCLTKWAGWLPHKFFPDTLQRSIFT